MSSTLLRRMVALGMTVVLSGIAVLPARAAGSVTVTVNGKTVNLAPPATMQAGRLFVPLRGVFENLGASVVYMNNGQLIGSGGGHRVFLNVGSRQAYVDGQSQMLEVAPFIIGASVFVPLRFVSEALGALVNYDRTNEVVAISGVDASPNRPSAQLPSPPPTPAHSSPSPTVAYSPPPTLSPTLAYSPTPTPSPTPAYSPLPTPSPTPAHSPPPTPLPTLAYSPPPTPSSVEPNTPPQPSGQSRVQLGNVQPGDGSSTGSRPTVQASFEGGDVDPNSVHVWFDGRDVSISSYISKRGVSYTPQSPILSGRHEVRLQGADLMGASFDQRWQFTSGLEPAAANTILEIVPAPGESVGPKFTVSGRTAPGATVTVQVGQASRGRGLGQFLGGILRVDGHATVQSTVIADQNGRFSSLVDIDAPRGASLGIVITSTDPDHGIAANPIRYSVQVR